MSRTKFFSLVLIAILAFSSLVACGPTSAPITNGDGNTTTTTTNVTNNFVTVEGNENHVQIGDNSVTSSENEVVATEVPAATEAPVEKNSEVCYFSAWHDGWQNGPERIHQDGILNRAELENGMSMQASWYKWTSTQKVDGYTVPDGFEPNNDGLQVLICGDVAYMPGREGSYEIPFWFISYVQLTSDGLLICKDDSGTPGNWDGECASTPVVVEGIPLQDITVPSDFQQNWTSLMELMKTWTGNTPDHGTIENVWTSTK